jgi:hypothetical protein
MKCRSARLRPYWPYSAPPSPGMPRCVHRRVPVLLMLALLAALVGCNSSSPSLSATTAAGAVDRDALNKAWACGLSLGLDKLKALGPDGNSLLNAINATLTGKDLAANRADLLKASIEFGIDIGPPWLQCFEPYFFPDQVGGGAAPAAPTGFTVRPDPNNGTVMLLTWNDSSDNVLYFVVSNGVEERYVPVQSNTGTINYTWTGLQPGSWSCFHVRASNGDTSSNWDPNSPPWYECAYSSSSQSPAITPIPPPAPTSSANVSPSALTGTWTGSYACAQGETGLRLVIQAAPGGTVTATFNFFALPSNPGVPSGSFTMTGTYSSAGVNLKHDRWISQPPGYEMVDLSADLPSQGGTVLSGTVTTCSTTFTLTRGAAG